MGNSESKKFSSFADWEKLQTHNGVDIYKNKHSNQLAEKRTVSLDPHFDLNDELQVYHLREFNNDSLVKSFGAFQVQNKGRSNGICSGHKKLQVLTERIPYRLSDLPQLTFAQSLLFLRESLRAYSKVFKSYGPTHVTKRMIGINDYGEVKCWLNQNWALNHPDHQFPTLQSTKIQGTSSVQNYGYGRKSELYDGKYRDQTEMVHNITSLIEEKCEEGRFPVAFGEEIELHSTTFRKLTLYLQDFLTVNKVFVPPKINYDTVFVSATKIRRQQVRKQQTGKTQMRNQGLVTTDQLGYNKNAIQQHQSTINTYNSGSQSYSNQGVAYTFNSSSYGNNTIPNQRLNFYHSYSKSPQNNTTAGYTVSKTNTVESVPMNNILQQPLKLQTTNFGSSNFPVQLVDNSYKNKLSYSFDKPLLSTNYQSYKVSNPSILEKPIQNQTNYSSSYYQYTTSNPSSTLNYKQTDTFSNIPSKTYEVKSSSFNTQTFPKEISNIKYQVSSDQRGNNFESSYAYNNSKGIAFSFDGNQSYNANFPDLVSKPISNQFGSTYESSNLTNMPTEGKYLNEFNSIIGTSLLKDNNYDSTHTQNYPITLTSTTNEFIYGKKIQKINPQVSTAQKKNDIFEGLLKMAENTQSEFRNYVPV